MIGGLAHLIGSLRQVGLVSLGRGFSGPARVTCGRRKRVEPFPLRYDLCGQTRGSCEDFCWGEMSVVDMELLVVPDCPNDRAPCGTVHPRIALDGRRSMLSDADPGGASERLCMLAAYDQLAIGAGW